MERSKLWVWNQSPAYWTLSFKPTDDFFHQVYEHVDSFIIFFALRHTLFFGLGTKLVFLLSQYTRCMFMFSVVISLEGFTPHKPQKNSTGDTATVNWFQQWWAEELVMYANPPKSPPAPPNPNPNSYYASRKLLHLTKTNTKAVSSYLQCIKPQMPPYMCGTRLEKWQQRGVKTG